MTVSTEFAYQAVPVRRWVLWRCDSCRRFIPRGALYLLSDHRTWCVRHLILCIPKDHERSTLFRVPTQSIQWSDQFNWWMTFLEASGTLSPVATAALIRFLGDYASFPPGWRPQRVDLTAPMPMGIV